MFCEKCGVQLNDFDEFCTNCGTKIVKYGVNATEKILDTEIQFKVQPSFKWEYMILPSVVFLEIIILILTIMLCTLSIGLGLGVFIFSTLTILTMYWIKGKINQRQYENYCFDFYKTKIIYKDSFLNLSEKEIKYKYIREIVMKQSILQRYFNLGNIVLYTNAETRNSNGISILNVENVQEIYKKIKSLIDER